MRLIEVSEVVRRGLCIWKWPSILASVIMDIFLTIKMTKEI